MSQEQERAIKASRTRQSGNREFGFVMAGAFLLFSLLSAWKHHGWPLPALPGLSLLFLLFALYLPSSLAPFNAVWSLLGRLLHRVMSPLILGALYFLFFTPLGVLLRVLKPDPLRLTFDPSAATYWIRREKQPGQGMENQF